MTTSKYTHARDAQTDAATAFGLHDNRCPRCSQAYRYGTDWYRRMCPKGQALADTLRRSTEKLEELYA